MTFVKKILLPIIAILLNISLLICYIISLAGNWYKIHIPSGKDAQEPYNLYFSLYKITNSSNIDASYYYYDYITRVGISHSREAQLFVSLCVGHYISFILFFGSLLSIYLSYKHDKEMKSLQVAFLLNFIQCILEFLVVFSALTLPFCFKGNEGVCQKGWCHSFTGENNGYRWSAANGYYTSIFVLLLTLFNMTLVVLRLKYFRIDYNEKSNIKENQMDLIESTSSSSSTSKEDNFQKNFIINFF